MEFTLRISKTTYGYGVQIDRKRGTGGHCFLSLKEGPPGYGEANWSCEDYSKSTKQALARLAKKLIKDIERGGLS